MRDFERIKVAYIRGGTSKGLYIMDNELPKSLEQRDSVILNLYGSPDVRQIDGVGGGDPLTSKVAIIKPSKRENADIDYTFGQVSIDKRFIDYKSNCGNISSGVGPFAIDEGLVEAVEPFTTVRIFNTNTKKVIEATVPVENGKAVTEGDFTIPGVPNAGAKVLLNFMDSGGSKTGKTLPTGQAKNIIMLESEEKVEVSIVDASTPSVFVKAESLGLSGKELPQEIESDQSLLSKLEEIRASGAVLIKLAKTKEEAGSISQSVPKIILVSRAQSYVSMNGMEVDSSEISFVARAMAMGKMHKAYAVTGGICTATASMIKGTVVNEISSGLIDDHIVIGHPSGTMNFNVEVGKKDNDYMVGKAIVERTARRIMDGYAYVPAKIYWGQKEEVK